MTKTVTIPWSGGEVTGRLREGGPTGVLLAHGAGTNQDHPMMVGLRDGLADSGLTVLTFNYPYTERGAKAPDRAPKLIECHRGALDFLRGRVDGLYLAGRSMGGRMATMLVAEGDTADGIILYAYPLHPAGKPEKLRIEHLSDVMVPMLFLQGTRDSLSRMELFDRHIAGLPNVDVELLEGAGHGPRGGGWNVDSMTERYVTASVTWIEKVSSGGTNG